MKDTIKNTKQNKAGGARVGAGAKKKDNKKYTMSLDPDQLAKVDRYRNSLPKPPTRSALYTTAMNYYLEKNAL